MEMEEMTQEYHDHMVKMGCDPHCHACGKKLNVGDLWSFKVFVEGVITADGFLVGDISGSACEECTKEDRDLPADERRRLEERLQALRAPMNEKRAASKKKKKKEARPRRGCFMLPDGTMF